MFTGIVSRKTELTDLNEISERLNFLGMPVISGSNLISFHSSSTFHDQKTQVSLYKNKKNETFINIQYSFIPNVLSWILGICFFPLGFLIFIIPSKEKDDFQFLINTIDL